MNYLEFNMQQSEALMNVLRRAMAEEIGMPCVMGTVYAAREFFESGGWISAASGTGECQGPAHAEDESNHSEKMEQVASNPTGSTILKSSSAKRIEECNEQGLEIAYGMLGQMHSDDVGVVNGEKAASETSVGKGGSWKYTIGACYHYLLLGTCVIFALANVVSIVLMSPCRQVSLVNHLRENQRFSMQQLPSPVNEEEEAAEVSIVTETATAIQFLMVLPWLLIHLQQSILT
jgi:hypothetical protein